MTKVKAVKQAKKLSVSRSGLAIAKALVQSYPKDAARIIKLMSDAATSSSMKRKLGRVQLALESLRKEAK